MEVHTLSIVVVILHNNLSNMNHIFIPEALSKLIFCVSVDEGNYYAKTPTWLFH